MLLVIIGFIPEGCDIDQVYTKLERLHGSIHVSVGCHIFISYLFFAELLQPLEFFMIIFRTVRTCVTDIHKGPDQC